MAWLLLHLHPRSLLLGGRLLPLLLLLRVTPRRTGQLLLRLLARMRLLLLLTRLHHVHGTHSHLRVRAGLRAWLLLLLWRHRLRRVLLRRNLAAWPLLYVRHSTLRGSCNDELFFFF